MTDLKKSFNNHLKKIHLFKRYKCGLPRFLSSLSPSDNVGKSFSSLFEILLQMQKNSIKPKKNSIEGHLGGKDQILDRSLNKDLTFLQLLIQIYPELQKFSKISQLIQK
jgi:hypothetical protein